MHEKNKCSPDGFVNYWLHLAIAETIDNYVAKRLPVIISDFFC